MKNVINVIVMLCLMVAFNSCYNDKADKLYPANTGPVTCDTTNVTYAATIAPIIAKNCSTSGCHDATTRQNTYDMTQYAGVLSATQSPLFIPDINFNNGLGYGMPYEGAKMSDCDIAKLEIWIRNGAPNN